MKSTHIILFTWLGWVVILIAFQAWADARLKVQWPDQALEWTTRFTTEGYQAGEIYLNDPFMNQQVAWDSEYYLAIAVGGYDDPATDLIGPPGNQVTQSYAFLPFYPFLIRLFMFPLKLLGLTPIATATLAGVIVSALGALGAMFALFALTKNSLGEDGGLRAAFYLIIFPTGFFLLQVYTEGLFVGLVFGCLAMLKRKQWLYAALLAGGATLTRAVGVALIIPMLIEWFRAGEWNQIYSQKLSWRSALRALLVFTPLITFMIWKNSYYGRTFDYVEKLVFGSTFMNIQAASADWTESIQSLSMDILQRGANYWIVILLFVLALVACFQCMKQYPAAAWLSLAIILISWGSGPASGMHRYVLTAPAVFIALAGWGRNPVFDRVWTFTSILWMGLLAALFALDMWVA
jgi:Gpi18-like mannosyltransferase